MPLHCGTLPEICASALQQYSNKVANRTPVLITSIEVILGDFAVKYI